MRSHIIRLKGIRSGIYFFLMATAISQSFHPVAADPPVRKNAPAGFLITQGPVPSGFQLPASRFQDPGAPRSASPESPSIFRSDQLEEFSTIIGTSGRKDGLDQMRAFTPVNKFPAHPGRIIGEQRPAMSLSTGTKGTYARPTDEEAGLSPGANPEFEKGWANFRNQNASTFTRLKRAESLSFTTQLAGMAVLQAVDIWDSGHRPFSDYKNNLRRAWTEAPKWDGDHIGFNYIGHPYTGSFTYNLMRSQASSPMVSWLFSTSQSLIWEFILEATEQHPSTQDLLITSNLGSLIGEGSHRITLKMRENGFSLAEKIIVFMINPAFVLNNGFY